MGSFLMAIFGVIKFIYVVISSSESNKIEQSQCADSVKKMVDTVCCCCVNYVFNCINSGAYTIIHLTGKPYCHSALESIGIKMTEIFTTPIINYLNMVFSILIRLGIAALTVLIAYIIMKSCEPFKSSIQDTTLCNIVIGIISFTISSFFASLYADAMESIFICHLVQQISQPKNPEQSL